MGEMRVIGVRVEQPQNQPVLLLRESDGDRYLPIWIGQTEATAIVLEQQGVEPARPLTHDLIKILIESFGRSLKEVRIVDLQEGTFYADLSSTSKPLSRHVRRTRLHWPCASAFRSSRRRLFSPRPVWSFPTSAKTRSRSSRNSSTPSRRTISKPLMVSLN